MKHFVAKYIVFSLCAYNMFSQSLYVNGCVKDAQTGSFLGDVSIILNDKVIAETDKAGSFHFIVDNNNSFTLSFKLLGYKTITKKYTSPDKDTLRVNVHLMQESYMLPGVSVSSERKVDTVFGTHKFSIADYEFYEDKMVLLTFKKSLNHPSLVLVDYEQNIIMQSEVGFEVLELIKDFENNIVVVAQYNNYFLHIRDDHFALEKISKPDYTQLIQPLVTKKNDDIYFSNYTPDFPDFTYYSYCTSDSSVLPIIRIVNEKFMHEYNMEYYYLKPKEQLFARNIAQEYNIDVHRVASTMSGLVSSIFYEPLYDPFFIINDTICIFNHCNDLLFKYNMNHQLIDSISINYHHPKNWREWKNKLIADENGKAVYALFQKGHHNTLKQINITTGKTETEFKLYFPNVNNIKIKDGYIYYIYRPFESLQEQFLYKELITN